MEYLKSLTVTTSARAHGATFFCLLVVGLVLTIPSMNAPFYWDDLHQVRVYAPNELAHGWTDGFDPDHTEDPGFRPLTMYFEQFRALAFGENTGAHRVFLLALFALFLTMVGILARRLCAASTWEIVLAGLIGLLHVDNVYHYFWITDGIYLVPGILIMGGILALLHALGSGRSIWLLPSILCTGMALLTREDALVVYPLLLWFGLSFVMINRQKKRASALSTWHLVLFGAVLMAMVSIFWYWRRVAVPEARSLNVDPAAILWAIGQTIQNVGDYQKLARPWLKYELLISLWRVWLGALLATGLVAVRRRALPSVIVWSGAVLIAALPAMVVARVNVLLLPATFWGFLVAKVLAEFWTQFHAPIWRVLSSGMILFALAAPAYGSFIFEQDIRVNSLDWMASSAKLLYGLTGHVTIPPARREAVQQELQMYGISDVGIFNVRWQRMNREALAEGRFGVNPQGLPFLPRFNFMPAFEVHPCCTPWAISPLGLKP
jgi:hypothetical protein